MKKRNKATREEKREWSKIWKGKNKKGINLKEKEIKNKSKRHIAGRTLFWEL